MSDDKKELTDGEKKHKEYIEKHPEHAKKWVDDGEGIKFTTKEPEEPDVKTERETGGL